MPCDRHHAELRVEAQVPWRPRGHDDAAERWARVAGPDLLEQEAADSRPLVLGADDQLGELLHHAEADDAGEADRPAAVLGDHIAALWVCGEELDQAAV